MILLTAELTETANSVGNIINTWGFPMFAMIVLALVLFAAIKYGVKRIDLYEQKSEKRTDKLEIELAKSHDALAKSHDVLADIARHQQQTIADNTAVISKNTEQLGRSSEVIYKALDNLERLMAMMQKLVDKFDN